MKYELTLVIKTNNTIGAERMQWEKIQADDLLQLVSQFNMVLLQVQRREHDEEISALRMENINDDIPF